MPNLPNFAGAPPEALDLFAWYHIVCSVGCLLWISAYVAFVIQGFRDRAPAIPTVAICLNFGWEAMYPWLPNFNLLWPALNIGWLGLDLILVYQLLRFGPAMQSHELLRRHFYRWVPLVFVLGVCGQLAFVLSFQDRLGLIDAFAINLVMSALFVWTWFERPDRRGLSIVGAWLKLFGTLGTGIGAHVFLPLMNPQITHWSFLTFLCGAILVLDSVYVVLLTTQPRSVQSLATLHADEALGIDADRLERLLPHLVGLGVEQKVDRYTRADRLARIEHGDEHPAARRDLGLELAARPARIAEQEQEASIAHAEGGVLVTKDRVERGRQP